MTEIDVLGVYWKYQKPVCRRLPPWQGGTGGRILKSNPTEKRNKEGALESREVHYRGRVQGVGFRFTVRLIAANFAVCGFVKNLPDGRVQLVVEGESDELERFLKAISAEMGRYIRDRQERTGPATGRFSAFEVRF